MSRIVITEFMDEVAVAWLQDRYSVEYEPDMHGNRERLYAAVRNANALIVRNRTQVDSDLLNHAGVMQIVGRLGVGLDNIDVTECQSRGINVIPAIGANADAVAEYVVCTAMMLLRGAYGASAAVLKGAWPRDELSSGQEIAGKLLGIVGLGSVGHRTATLARAMNMRVAAYDPGSPQRNVPEVAFYDDLDALLAVADIVSIHVPLQRSTRGLFDETRIRSMKRGAILINVARGGIVDENALAKYLTNGHLKGAVLDVYEQEPLPAGSVLAGVPNLILTPHIAGVTVESNKRVSDMIARKIAQHINPNNHSETVK